MDRQELTYGSLFSGIGGFDLGFDRASMRCAWQVEIDAAARSVLTRHWPDVPKFTDVRDVGAHNLTPVDVICFGSPCQDLSVAGKRAGMAGERSGLFYEAIRIIRELRPAIAVWENVPGALSSNHGRDFGAAIDALADAGAMDICWRVLDAQWFGVAQRRRRLFVVADFRAERAAEVLFEPEGVSRHPQTSGEAGQNVAGTLGGGSGSRGWAADTDRMTFVPFTLDWQAGSSGDTSWRGKARSFIVDKPGRARSLTANHTLAVAHALTAEGHDASEDGTGRGTPLVAYGVSHQTTPKVAHELMPTIGCNMTGGVNHVVAHSVALRGRDGGATAELGGDVATALRASQGGGQVAVAFQQNTRDEVRYIGGEGQIAGALAASPSMKQQNYVQAAMAVRRLTPTECERLQGFPDGWTAGQADSQRYRQLGNAVAVPCSEWIAKRIMEASHVHSD